jgi:hypothetical protein
LLDRRLSLPEVWFDEGHRTLWQDCQIPDEITFQTKHALAAQMVEDIMASGLPNCRGCVGKKSRCNTRASVKK